MKRVDGRSVDEGRPLTITPRYLKHAEGSVLIEVGDTKVICAATVEDRVPSFLRGGGSGWVTAEYGMLPRSSQERIPRESVRGKVSGRTQEIQRLIGRSLRAVVDLKALGERTIWIDCDVIQADGGTRTASITGAFIAFWDACQWLMDRKRIVTIPILDHVAATSVGIIDGTPMLDLCYTEDSTADVDMNVVMTGTGKFVEIQGTAEETPFSKEEADHMLDLVAIGFVVRTVAVRVSAFRVLSCRGVEHEILKRDRSITVHVAGKALAYLAHLTRDDTSVTDVHTAITGHVRGKGQVKPQKVRCVDNTVFVEVFTAEGLE